MAGEARLMTTRHTLAGLLTVLAIAGTAQVGLALPEQAAGQAQEHAAAQAADGPRGPVRGASGTAVADRPDQEAAPENRLDADRDGADATAANETGPQLDMPDQVPAHVTQIHETILAFLDGEFDRLGPRIQGIVGRN